MQIRCYHCQKPFALKHEIVLSALDMLTSQDLSHYDAHCPHCRRVNRVSRDELLRAAPDWKKQAAEHAGDG
jgi:phage FluMu protein Com